MLGTTALELCYLARGSLDGFVCSGDEIWDFAAGLLIVEEARGTVSDWCGNTWNGTGSYILASNGHTHQMLVENVHDLQEEGSG